MCRDKLEFAALTVSSIFYKEIQRHRENEAELIRNRVCFASVSQKQFKACEITPSFTSCDYTGGNSLEDLSLEPQPVFRQRILVVYKDIHLLALLFVIRFLHGTCKTTRNGNRSEWEWASEGGEDARIVLWTCNSNRKSRIRRILLNIYWSSL